VSLLSYERLCAEIIQQSDLLGAAIAGTDLTVAVPSCPGWTVGQLVRHVDGGHRWAEELVRTGATEPTPDTSLRDLSQFTDEDPALLGPILNEGAELLSGTLLQAGPDAPVWTPTPHGDAAFFARRFAHETAIHRADAALAVGAPFALKPDTAVDGIEEWLELGSLPMHFDIHPAMRELIGPGRTIGLQATDTATDWIVDLTGPAIDWRRGIGDAAVTLRGAVTDLLLLIYQRRAPVEPYVTITGDRGLLQFWLDRVDFC
jgi:uncharacterized protein (TIGR03083 family)